jgi:hypothetical protein
MSTTIRYAWLALLLVITACASGPDVVHAPVGAPPQMSPDELDRQPQHIAHCIVAIEISAEGGPGAPVLFDARRSLEYWHAGLDASLAERAAQESLLTSTREHWADVLRDKSAAQREVELGEMVSVCEASVPDQPAS